MASNHHTDEVFKPKRKPKNPIKFNLVLNEEQKLAKALIIENHVVVLMYAIILDEHVHIAFAVKYDAQFKYHIKVTNYNRLKNKLRTEMNK